MSTQNQQPEREFQVYVPMGQRWWRYYQTVSARTPGEAAQIARTARFEKRVRTVDNLGNEVICRW